MITQTNIKYISNTFQSSILSHNKSEKLFAVQIFKKKNCFELIFEKNIYFIIAFDCNIYTTGN